ncbi:MAG: crossover junction endodeoxyribonuclease RuvC [Thermoanaerobaculia bacterium]
MRVLGIDPGSHHTGYGFLEVERGRLRALGFGRISPGRKLPIEQRLARVVAELSALIEEWAPEAAVLEAPFLGLNPRSLVVLAQARGALLALAAQRGLAVHEYSPAEIKSAVAGHGRADKEQVERMVRLQLALGSERMAADAADALAAALCYALRQRLDRLVRGH